ncbi:MAG: hypothetical protein IKI97_04225 [Clostridia bacterium]|nr:hypothetical protein [Clostridia bacterium]
MLFGFGTNGLLGVETLYTLRSYAVIFIIGIIAAMPISKLYKKKVKEMPYVQMILCGILLITVTAYLVDGSFNPFLYFRF